MKLLHCWFDFEDGYWLDDDTKVPGHTCMLEDGHSGPHEPTPDDEIGVTFVDLRRLRFWLRVVRRIDRRLRSLLDGQLALARDVRAEFTGRAWVAPRAILPPNFRLPSTAPIPENPAARIDGAGEPGCSRDFCQTGRSSDEKGTTCR